MRVLILSSAVLMMSLGEIIAQSGNQKANEIVSFLEGKWHNYSIYLSNGNPINQQDYKETMSIKNDSTLTITAHNYKDGKDLTKDMILIIRNGRVIMQQDNFIATGTQDGNVYYLKGSIDNKEFKFRLYTMGDKYIFHSEVWVDGKIEMMNMSYLLRE